LGLFPTDLDLKEVVFDLFTEPADLFFMAGDVVRGVDMTFSNGKTTEISSGLSGAVTLWFIVTGMDVEAFRLIPRSGGQC
jgi:hypothetical protein